MEEDGMDNKKEAISQRWIFELITVIYFFSKQATIPLFQQYLPELLLANHTNDSEFYNYHNICIHELIYFNIFI